MRDPVAAMPLLRSRIDGIDEKIAGLLAQRFVLTTEVGRLKAANAEPAIDPERQIQRAALMSSLTRSLGLPEDLLRDVYRVISTEVARQHRAAGASG